MPMSEFSLSITLGIVAALASLVGSLVVILKKGLTEKFLFYWISLGSGFILGATFFDMIPESLEASSSAIFFIVLGYFIIHFFEHVFSSHFHFGEETHKNDINKQVAFSILLAFVVHTFLDGVAIGSGFAFNALMGFTIFTAVVLHKIPDGLTIASVMLASGRDKKGALGASLLLALSTIAGAFWSATFTGMAPILLPLATGVFLHISLTDLIPEVTKKKSLIYPLVIVVGVLLYYVTRIALIKFGIA